MAKSFTNAMRLYHFSYGDLFKVILASNAVLKSTIISEGELAAATAVSLTSDLEPSGHGLPSGGNLTQEQANRVVVVRQHEHREPQNKRWSNPPFILKLTPRIFIKVFSTKKAQGPSL